jgi:bla regulator protein blaR1
MRFLGLAVGHVFRGAPGLDVYIQVRTFHAPDWASAGRDKCRYAHAFWRIFTARLTGGKYDVRRLLTVGVPLLASALASELVPSTLQGQTAPAPDQQAVKFDVTSVKPNDSGDDSVSMTPSLGGIAWTNATLQMMMRLAYRVQDFQIVGSPNWLSTARFDVAGKVDTNTSREVLPLASMLRALLVERFRLAVHNETRELPIYALVAARSDGQFGPQLRRPSNCVTPVEQRSTRPEDGTRTPSLPTCGNKVLPGNMSGRGVTMLTLTGNLSVFAGRTVVDRTGLSGTFDFDLTWTPDLMTPGRDAAGPGGVVTDSNGPSLPTALQEQLGVKLESTKGPVNVIVIDHVEKPTPD